MHSDSDHFKGKSVPEHLKEAIHKGIRASAEVHGTEMPGHLASGADAAKEMTLALLILWVLFTFGFPTPHTRTILLLFSLGWVVWKTGRSSLLGWSRMERLHRLIEEERWEIEHHRGQEKEELTEIYRAKGFSGRLLEEVIDVLMADDNRLLQVMLEEELRVNLGVHEHPLKQASGAFIGSAVSGILLITAYFLSPMWGIPSLGLILLIVFTILSAKFENNRRLHAVVWTIALALLAIGSVYFLRGSVSGSI